MKSLKRELLELTKPFVTRADQVQGPGGNTSVKNDLGQMIIKASGYRFEEIDSNKGFSIVNSENIKSYFQTVQLDNKEKEEKRSVELVLDNVLKDDQGVRYPKPSMETGFHAVLDTYVVHTHSVWSNLINCNAEGSVLIERLKKKLTMPIAALPYISPGFGLSYTITQMMEEAGKKQEPVPRVFFLANHGIIAHGKTLEGTQALLENTDTCIRELFGIDNIYPSAGLEKKGENIYTPIDSYINDLIKLYKVKIDFFEKVLFPDQTVFFKDNVSFDANDIKKININVDGQVTYCTNYREALSIHETITAYFFIYHTIKQSAYTPQFISSVEVDYINGMDMEKHRKSLMSETIQPKE
jgi:ribulose-5-phosphate 4-epimerase/fuculose-1-phosphate aldolase